MAVNKVIYDGNTLIDLTDDTVVKDALVEGHTAHGANGELIVGGNPYAKQSTDNTVNIQAGLIQQIKNALGGKAGGGGSLPALSNPGTAADLAEGKQLIDQNGEIVTGTMGKGLVVKSGTTTNRTINTGLSSIDQFFIYKESQTATGLIRLHYNNGTTSRMYASAWSTNNYGTKTITNGTGGVSVSGGTFTISATSATSGGLSSNVTYKWVAVGTE